MKKLIIIGILAVTMLTASEANWMIVVDGKARPEDEFLNSLLRSSMVHPDHNAFRFELQAVKNRYGISVTFPRGSLSQLHSRYVQEKKPHKVIQKDTDPEIPFNIDVEDNMVYPAESSERRKHLRDTAVYFLNPEKGCFRPFTQAEHMHCKRAAQQLNLSVGKVENMCTAIMLARHTTAAEASNYLSEKLSPVALRALAARTENERFHVLGVDKARMKKDKLKQQALHLTDLRDDVSVQPRKGFKPRYSLEEILEQEEEHDREIREEENLKSDLSQRMALASAFMQGEIGISDETTQILALIQAGELGDCVV